MAHAQLGSVVKHLHRLATVRRTEELADQELLQLFARHNDQSAFTALVERHGGLVLGVCKHLLQHAQDAEDAFQATFLVLARKAGSIRKGQALASWLHGVARRMAMKAQRDSARRRRHEKNVVAAVSTDSVGELSWREVQAILDEEIQRLPEKYRSAFVLCCLENQSRADAAKQLGVKEGTLSSRLAYAKQSLRQRLALRGVSLAAVLAGTALTTEAVSAAMIQATIQQAVLYAAGKSAGGILSAHVVALARGALKAMLLTKLKAGVSVVAAIGVLTLGGGVAVRSGLDSGQALAAGSEAQVATVTEPKGPESGIFRDITAEAGVDFTYRNGADAGQSTMLEELGGGVAVLDFDGDGLIDIFVTGGGYFAGPNKQQIHGHPCKLYRNRGNGTFEDVTHAVGLDGPGFYTHGAAVVDYDCDGWPDLLITGWSDLALYHNETDGKGGRRFVDVTAKAGLPSGLWTTSAAFADLDGDGFPDLYLCQYVDWSFANNPTVVQVDGKHVMCPKVFSGLPHKLYRNNGNGTFTDVSQEAGIRPGGKDASKGLGVVIADVNDDGKPDIFVVNDTTDHFLYRNECSHGKFRFVEIGMQAGVARDDRGVPNGSKGVAVGDFDGSGRPSFFVTNDLNEVHGLYKNTAATAFQFGSFKAGLAAIGQKYVGWGTAFIDYDRDGDLDLMIANGGQRPVLLRNVGKGKFVDVSAKAGVYFQQEHNARGVAFLDFDNDGRLDLIISHVNEPVVILRNQTLEKDHHWIGFELIGKNRRDVVGAKVLVETDSRTQTSFAQSGASYASSSDRRHLFGLGKTEKVKHIRVIWPGGQQQQWDGLAVDRYWRLTEGEGAEEVRKR
jgi:RNA polymerase sigma factor (sigma-70 family)